jgi:hypothetical protein
MGALQQGVYALARTRRRRILWCAWWSGMPSAEPFREPDAWGGAASEDEARDAAVAAAGMPLVEVEPHWAGAWVRVRAGREPFPSKAPRPGARPVPPQNPYTLLGLEPGADLPAIKAAYRQKALDTHPDRGGSEAAFILVKRAYDSLRRRARR